MARAVTVLACYHLKGGVGKTAAAVNLADLSARAGIRTLLWDLDPQGAATFHLRGHARRKGGLKGMLRLRRDPREAVRATPRPGLDLLPGSFAARQLDVLVSRGRKPRRVLERVLAPLRAEYDRVILDCAPSIGPAADAVFRAADLLLVPVIPTPLSVRSLDILHGHLAGLPRKRRPRVLAFFSMVDGRKGLHRATCEAARTLPFEVCDARIPYATHVERMALRREPLEAFAAGCAAAEAYRRLYREVAGRLALVAGPAAPARAKGA